MTSSRWTQQDARPSSLGPGHLSAALLLLAIGAFAVAPADARGGEIDYAGDVLPIFRQHCLSCHGPDKKKAGLDLASYSTLLVGGSGGAVVQSGDPDGSRLLQLVAHNQEPKMPPNQARLPDATIDLITQWIAGGLLEREGGARQEKTKGANLGVMISHADGGASDAKAVMPVRMPKEPAVVPPRPFATSALAASSNAPLVAVGSQRQVLLYHTETLELLGVIPIDGGQPRSLRFSPDGGLLVVGGGEAARVGFADVYDVLHGDRLLRVGDELDQLQDADLSRDGSQLAIATTQKKVRRIAADGSDDVLQTISKHSDWVTQAAFSPDGVLLATGDRAGGVMIWEAYSGQDYLALDEQKGAVTAISWRADSNVVAVASEDGFVRLFEMSGGKIAKAVRAHTEGALAVAFAPDGRFATGGRDRFARFFDAAGSEVKKFGPAADIVVAVAVSADGHRLFRADWSGEISVFDTDTGDQVGSLDINPPTLRSRVVAAHDALQASEAAAKSAGSAHAEAAAREKSARDARDDAIAARAAIEKTLGETASRLAEQTDTLRRSELALDRARRSADWWVAELEHATATRNEELAFQEGLRRRLVDLEGGVARLARARDQLQLAAAATAELATQSNDAVLAAATERVARAMANADAALQAAKDRRDDAARQCRAAAAQPSLMAAEEDLAGVATGLAHATAHVEEQAAAVLAQAGAVRAVEDEISEIAARAAKTLASEARAKAMWGRLDTEVTTLAQSAARAHDRVVAARVERARWTAETVNLECDRARRATNAAREQVAVREATRRRSADELTEVAFSLQDTAWRQDESRDRVVVLSESIAQDRRLLATDEASIATRVTIADVRARLAERLTAVLSPVLERAAPQIEAILAPIHADRAAAEDAVTRARERLAARTSRIDRNEDTLATTLAAISANPEELRGLREQYRAAAAGLADADAMLEEMRVTLLAAETDYAATETRYQEIVAASHTGEDVSATARRGATATRSDPTGTQ